VLFRSVWVQFKNSAAPAINGKLVIQEGKENSSDFKIQNISQNSIKISYKQVTTRFIAPMQTFALHLDKANKKQPVHSIDVTDGGLGVSSSTDGSLLIWTLKDGQIRRNLNGHISDVYLCKFFPSGIVCLSGGADLRLKIWSAENGKSPVTLVGHSSGITDVSIVEKGRNIVSVSRDGTAKLWDIGEAKCLHTFNTTGCIINSCCIQSVQSSLVELPLREEQLSEREIGTLNKLVGFACEDGHVEVIALGSRVKIFEYKCESAVNCCCFIDETTLVCGTQNGYLYIFDLHNKILLDSWKEYRSSILSIQRIEQIKGFVATTADGSCFIFDMNAKGVVAELTGPDCDPVYKMAHNKSFMFTCCRDGLIRKYDLNHIFNAD